MDVSGSHACVLFTFQVTNTYNETQWTTVEVEYVFEEAEPDTVTLLSILLVGESATGSSNWIYKTNSFKMSFTPLISQESSSLC